jgi:integrase/recombinase XerD
MITFSDLASVPCDPPAPFTDQLRLAVAAYLARFKGSSREHTESDLRRYLAWCAEHALDPLAAQRAQLELYIRWMQEIRRFKPSTVSRRFSVTAGFYRTCTLDGILQHSPAEHVRRPTVPAESRTLGFTHLQFEALLTAARESPDPCDFALMTMLGLLGLRIFEATGANIADLGEEHGHRVLGGVRQGHQGRAGAAAASGRPGDRPDRRLQSPRADPAEHPRYPDGPARKPPAACGTLPRPAASRSPAHIRTCCATLLLTSMLDSGVDLRDVQIAARHADHVPQCAMTGPARTWTATRTTSWPPTWPPVPDQPAFPRLGALERPALPMSVSCTAE